MKRGRASNLGVSRPIVLAMMMSGAGGSILAQTPTLFPSTVRVTNNGAAIVVTGQLVDSESNRPLGGGVVVQGSHGGFIDPDGTFRLLLPVGTDITNLEIDLFGYRRIELALAMGDVRRFYMNAFDLTDCEMFGLPADARERRVRLELSDSLSGQPVDTQVWLRLRSLNSAEPLVSGHTSPDGVVFLPTVLPGVYHLTVDAIGYHRWTIEVLRLRANSCFGVEALELRATLRPR